MKHSNIYIDQYMIYNHRILIWYCFKLMLAIGHRTATDIHHANAKK